MFENVLNLRQYALLFFGFLNIMDSEQDNEKINLKFDTSLKRNLQRGPPIGRLGHRLLTKWIAFAGITLFMNYSFTR